MASIEEYEKQHEVSFDIADLFSFLWQKKFHIILSVTLLVSAGYYYVKKIPKTYLASSTLLLDDQSGGVNITGLAALTGRSPSKMDTHIEFIRSKQFISSVVQSMDLHRETEFFPTTGSTAGQPDLAHAVEVVIEDLTLSNLNETDMLKVSFVSKTPEIAARVVNQIGPMFFAFQSDKSRERAEIASRWLNSQVGEIQGKLTASETNLQQFLEDNQLVDLASQLGLVQSEISTLMREQLQNDKVVNEFKSVVNQSNKVIDDPEMLIGIPQIASSTVIIEMRRRILEQEQRLSEISKRYKYKHYRHITASSQLQELKVELARALQQSVASLKREYGVMLERKAMLARSLSEAKQQHSKLGRLEIELTKLRRELESNQKLYDAFLSRLQETELLKDTEQQGNYAVIDYAAVPKRAFKPNVALSLIVIVLLSTVLSTGFWLMVHLLSDKRSKVRQVLRSLDVQVLAELPKLKKRQQNLTAESLFDQRKQNFVFSESVRSLRTVLLVNKSEEQSENRIIAVTRISATQKKSGLVVQLADSFSRLEKTLLLDADLRTPSIAGMFNLPSEKAGLTSLLSKRARLSECIYRPSNTPLRIMSGGPIPADPLVYLSKPRFASFIEKLSIINERLVIDLPAINAFSDALVVSKLADAVVLECDIENISVEELLMSIQRLQESGCPLMGVVLTNVKSKRKYK